MTISTQALLARVLSEPDLFAGLRADPAGFAERYGVDPDAAHALSTVDPSGLVVTADVARRKRWRALAEEFPASLRLLGSPDADARLTAAVQATRLVSYPDLDAAARRLGELADVLATDGAMQQVRDILRFEVLWYQLRAGDWQEPRPRAGCPALAKAVAVGSYCCPVAKLTRRLLAGQSLSGLESEPTHYVLSMQGRRDMRAIVVNQSVADVLGHCDGMTSAVDIASATGLDAEQVRRLLDQAVARGLVVLAE